MTVDPPERAFVSTDEDLVFPDERDLRSEEVCQAVGCTYRMLDYWVRCGYVCSVDEHGRPYTADYTPGSGAARYFQPSEVAVVGHIVRLTYAGFILRAAHDIARALVDPERPRVVHLRARDRRKTYILVEGSPL